MCNESGMRRSKLVWRNSELCTTNNTHQGLLRDVMDHPLATRTHMVRDMVQGMAADTTMVMTTTPTHSVRGALLQFPSWVLLLVVCC